MAFGIGYAAYRLHQAQQGGGVPRPQTGPPSSPSGPGNQDTVTLSPEAQSEMDRIREETLKKIKDMQREMVLLRIRREPAGWPGSPGGSR